ncbi:MAG: DUF5009 domain-containing protein [Verrucomicrobiae bacterium]|nr:DUF5009 domain-containing protein [Verrucomicrobiae bacterium]
MSKKHSEDSVQAGRLLSLDTYRGLVMFFLAANGFGLAAAAKQAGDGASEWLQTLALHNSHPEWISQFRVIGFSLWDMIQPSFMFIVGVSMPWSYAKRAQLGHSYLKRARHAWGRAVMLILLGVFLTSQRQPETNWMFTNVLCQIGLGYGLLFHLVGRSIRFQVVVATAVLIGSWLAMVLYPAPEGTSGLAVHFQQGTNAIEAFDRWFLNLFPRSKPFESNPGGYGTLNFVPAFVTMLFGVMCGQWLKAKEPASGGEKVKKLLLAGALCLVLGVAASYTICPVVKRIWTPSWVLFSGAYCIWLLALLYWVVDLKGWKWWTFPFVVVGLNPITAYVMSMTMKGWVRDSLKTHLNAEWFTGTYGPVIEACAVMFVFWLILWWMYRNRFFIRI